MKPYPTRHEFEVIGPVREFMVNGANYRAFEFRGDLSNWTTGLAIFDGFDAEVFEVVPSDWRTMGGRELLRLAAAVGRSRVHIVDETNAQNRD